MRIRREKTDGNRHKYAVAVRDSAELFLWLIIVRESSNVYVNIPRDEPAGSHPHVSLHADGQHHVKSYGKVRIARESVRPVESFKGTQSVFMMSIRSGDARAVNKSCRPELFSGVFEIPVDELEAAFHRHLAVDVVDQDCQASVLAGAEIITQHTFRDVFPWILVTLFDHKMGAG